MQPESARQDFSRDQETSIKKSRSNELPRQLSEQVVTLDFAIPSVTRWSAVMTEALELPVWTKLCGDQFTDAERPAAYAKDLEDYESKRFSAFETIFTWPGISNNAEIAAEVIPLFMATADAKGLLDWIAQKVDFTREHIQRSIHVELAKMHPSIERLHHGEATHLFFRLISGNPHVPVRRRGRKVALGEG